MPHQITVTADTGPGRQNTGVVLTNVNKVEFELDKKIARITREGGASNIAEYDLATVVTMTFTISGGNYTMVMSE